MADVVWRAFGSDVANYVEPFFGSGAVLLARPGGAGKIETVNDADGHLANVWRSLQQAPDEVAQYCDWPVNEADLHPRHRWLIEQRGWLTRKLMADPDFCFPKAAGWWLWGASMWIGSGWCSAKWDRGGTRPNMKRQGVHRQMPNQHVAGIHRKRPECYRGRGVHAQKVNLYARGHGRGIRGAQLPALSWERGVHNRMMNAGNLRRGINRDHAPPCTEWFAALQDRLRRVRVCCGDWSRVLGNSVIGTTRVRNNGMVPCAIFLDPPYSDEIRSPECYAVDDGSVAQLVAQWAREHGDDPDLRIALCGYEGEHEMPGWTEYAWRGARGYSKGNNREKERIWFSPHCLPLEGEPQLQLALEEA